MPDLTAQLDRLDPHTALLGTPEEPVRLIQSIQLALDLLDRGETDDIALARRIVEAVISLQRHDPPGERGLLPMLHPPLYEDLNANLFQMPKLIALAAYREQLGDELANRLEHTIKLATLMTERRWDTEIFDPHRDFVRYTNIFMIYIQALLLAGLHMDDQRLIDKAHGQWKRWFHHISYLGIDEFASPGYARIDADAMVTLYERSPDVQVRQQAAVGIDHLAAVIHALDHPTLGMAVTGSSRNGRGFVEPGRDGPAWIGQPRIGSHELPAHVLEEHANRRFPHQARGRATEVPFRFATWQDTHAGLGTMTGGQYFWQHMHCVAAVGTGPENRATAFLPGSFCPVAGYTDQRGPEALCVFTRRPNPLFRTQRPASDDEIIAQTSTFGLGLSDGWTIEQRDVGLVQLTAHGHRLTVRPFIIDDAGTVQPITLEPVERDEMSWRGAHRKDRPFTELMFPEDVLWFGAHVALSPIDTPAPPPASAPTLTHEARNRVRTFTAGPCHVRVFEQPAGETTQLYDDDWRVTPLLESPAMTIWPGDALRPDRR